MAFAAVGGLMLLIVLIFYMRMVNEKLKPHQRETSVDAILSKVEIFESLAKDKEALEFIEDAIMRNPKEKRLIDKKSLMAKRLNESEHH